MQQSIRRLLAVVTLSLLLLVGQAQSDSNLPIKKETKPYMILTAGKEITIKSTKNIKHIMLWTTSGNRVVEQKDINKTTFTINIPINQKAFFLMIGMVSGKIYTEKIGLRD